MAGGCSRRPIARPGQCLIIAPRQFIYSRPTAQIKPSGVHTRETIGSPRASVAILLSVSMSMPEWLPPMGWLCQVPTNMRYPMLLACASLSDWVRPSVPRTNRASLCTLSGGAAMRPAMVMVRVSIETRPRTAPPVSLRSHHRASASIAWRTGKWRLSAGRHSSTTPYAGLASIRSSLRILPPNKSAFGTVPSCSRTSTRLALQVEEPRCSR